ncbi:recombinase family protein [Saccharopolyspora sp. 5N708]|uniref:recombinase family protein n=1 Tax=Saccharopolyspora sp. 5N708 TaxID=3457424 RepID=UPI003FD01D0B
MIYLRVSSVQQVGRDDNPEGISIPAQRAACHRKAAQLGLTIADEYVELGRSATEITKRSSCQRMLGRIRDSGDVSHVIVYKLSRLARNRVDDALVMADLRQRGIAPGSATESVDNTPVGQLMHGILATFNEYQSRESGADIAYKMGQSPQRRHHRSRPTRLPQPHRPDRRPRGPHHHRRPRTRTSHPAGFELFATGNLTLDQLSKQLHRQGLRTCPTR